MNLFPDEQIAGIFRGFDKGGLEFHADIVLPYQHRFHSMPMHGLFVIVQLESEDEGVLGRITSVASRGRLASGAGEDFGIRAVSEGRPIPEDLREQYLKYEVDIRVLGVIRRDGKNIVFAASHRRLPHVGSKVAFLSPELLREVTGHNDEGAEIGHLALGEYIYAEGDERLEKKDWMQILGPSVVPRFDMQSLVSRRSFVFARAGFGKSNLVKLLFSNLYKGSPVVEKRGGREVPVGTIIFDPDGEYYWPDDKGRPGLCDVPELEDKIVVFTPKAGPSEFYGSFIAGNIRLDIRRLRPVDVVSIALSPERQTQQNVRKIVGLNDASWRELVDLIYRDGHGADENTIRKLLQLQERQDPELYAARANMTHIVNMLHDPSSQMLDMLLAALQEGKLCIVDISQMRGNAGLTLSGIILRRIFDHNQQEFTKAAPRTIPTIAVVEEAQSVLNPSGEAREGPYIEWVKEGRKYDLGAVLITQQPGSIPGEILSQGDNWFIFHLLASGDLSVAKRANAHFSDDLLSSLLNEPIAGNGIFWSSTKEKPIPIPVRVMSFESAYSPLDEDYSGKAVSSYACQLKDKFDAAIAGNQQPQKEGVKPREVEDQGVLAAELEDEGDIDVLEIHSARAIEAFRNDHQTLERIRNNGLPWKGVQEALKRHLPDILDDRDQFAYNLVIRAMDEVFGKQGAKWDTEKREKKSGPGFTTWVVLKKLV
jgi:DNA helicase HerA-like ATPase